MATKFSVNVNKIALLRNSRGRNYPDVLAFARRCLELGADGITLHPRQDQRHARYSDVAELKKVCDEYQAELNVEGYPSEEFLQCVIQARPTQCTLVPDAPGQLTSDHGWDVANEAQGLTSVLARLRTAGIRSSLFLDVDYPHLEAIVNVGADRVELYTEPYAESFGTEHAQSVRDSFADTAKKVNALGLTINAGHDLNLDNLAYFLEIPNILEVSIGHALVVECIEFGMEEVFKRYAAIISGSR